MLKNYTVPILMLCLAMHSGCRSGTSLQSDYFEGQIEYRIIYKTYDPNLNLTRLAALRGTRMVLTFSEGNFVQDYFTNRGKLVQRNIRRVKDHRFYIEFPDRDSVYFSDTRNSGHNTTLTLMGTETIQGYPCREVLSVAIPKQEFPHFERQTTRLFVTDALAINPAWYANYKDGGYDRLAELVPGCVLQIVRVNDSYEMDIRAEKITPGQVDDSIFEVNREKVLVDALNPGN